MTGKSAQNCLNPTPRTMVAKTQNHATYSKFHHFCVYHDRIVQSITSWSHFPLSHFSITTPLAFSVSVFYPLQSALPQPTLSIFPPNSAKPSKQAALSRFLVFMPASVHRVVKFRTTTYKTHKITMRVSDIRNGFCSLSSLSTLHCVTLIKRKLI